MRAVELSGASVLVTGGARGIGRATAEAFVRRGAVVAIGDLDAASAASAAQDVGARCGLALEVSDRDSFEAFVAAASERCGPPVVLVNNAGIMPLGRFLEEADETSRRTFEVNVWGPLLGMKVVLPGMIDRGHGHVVNVTSMMGKLHVPGAAVYGASKHAATALSASVRSELRGTGVSVTTVLPSAVRTELVAGVPLGRGMPTVEPEDVAKTIVESCGKRQAEAFVPGWLAAYEPVVGITPAPLVGAVRRLIGEDRVLNSLDSEARAGYERRIRS